MIIKVDAVGDACPIPVIKTKNAIKELNGVGTVEVFVDNEIAVQNLEKMAKQMHYTARSEKLTEDRFRVVIETGNIQSEDSAPADRSVLPDNIGKNIVVAVSSSCMGAGNDELGAVLIKGFLFALTQQNALPDTILFYNGGATLTTEGSASLDDLKSLETQGVEILTCGTCLNYYGLSDKLRVGGVTNMYAIAEKLTTASLVVKP